MGGGRREKRHVGQGRVRCVSGAGGEGALDILVIMMEGRGAAGLRGRADHAAVHFLLFCPLQRSQRQ